jgi:hypothetical protein
MKYTAEMVSNGMIYVPSFMNIGIGSQAIFILVLLMERIYEVHQLDGLRGHDIHKKAFKQY